MLSNANTTCAILSTCLQYADHAERASLPIGVKGRRKEKNRKGQFLELPRPKAGS